MTDPTLLPPLLAMASPFRPRIICLVGSSQFKEEFHRVGERLEKAGCLVLMMAFFQHADDRPVTPEQREVLYRVDRFRIDLADEVWVVDEVVHTYTESGPARVVYIGEDTQREIIYAKERGKPIHYHSRGFPI